MTQEMGLETHVQGQREAGTRRVGGPLGIAEISGMSPGRRRSHSCRVGMGTGAGARPDPGLAAGGGHSRAELAGPSETPAPTGCPVRPPHRPAKLHDPADVSALGFRREDQRGDSWDQAAAQRPPTRAADAPGSAPDVASQLCAHPPRLAPSALPPARWLLAHTDLPGLGVLCPSLRGQSMSIGVTAPSP